MHATPVSPAAVLKPLLLAALSCATPAFAGGAGENVVLIVDPASPDSLWAANHYVAARDVPAENVLYMQPGASDFAAFRATNIPALLGTLEQRGIADHVDYVLVMPGTNFFVPASGLVSDGCAAVHRFGIAGAYTLAFKADDVLGGVASSLRNRYWSGDDSVTAFDSETLWLGGQASQGTLGDHYFLGAMLGYTGERGNTMAEILAMVDRSVAVDGTFPAGTTYFMKTTDVARSGPRDPFYVAVAASIVAIGGNAVRLFADLPLGQHDALGIMTGRATLDILGADMTLLPGSFADHLTSFAGRFDTSSQTKMSLWITKGASGTSGAVEEPCNYAGKFPHARMHLYYRKGLPLGEAWLRSMEYVPFQNLLYGDPLTRPFAYVPSVDVPDAPTGPLSGTVLLHPVVSTSAPGAAIDTVELWVDGLRVRAVAAGQALPLQAAALGDGWHELRVVASDDSELAASGHWIGWVEVVDAGRSATLTPNLFAGDQGQAFDLSVTASSAGLDELRVVQNGRVLASTPNSSDTLRLYGVNLGAGPAQLQAEALYADGSRVRSAPVTIAVTELGVGTSGALPVVFDYRATVPTTGTRVLELPAAFDDALASATFEVLAGPAQATLAPLAGSGFVLLTPNQGASGSDSLSWRVTTPSGVSAAATLSIEYGPTGAVCTPPTGYCPAAPNSTGAPAGLSWIGEPSLLANDSTLFVAGAVPGQPGVFFYGPNQVQLPFGDGFRCVGGTTTRLPGILWADPFGDLQLDVDLNAAPAAAGAGEILPGSTWNFQYWYRDPAGPGGTGFNLSNAASVQFCP